MSFLSNFLFSFFYSAVLLEFLFLISFLILLQCSFVGVSLLTFFLQSFTVWFCTLKGSITWKVCHLSPRGLHFWNSCPDAAGLHAVEDLFFCTIPYYTSRRLTRRVGFAAYSLLERALSLPPHIGTTLAVYLAEFLYTHAAGLGGHIDQAQKGLQARA